MDWDGRALVGLMLEYALLQRAVQDLAARVVNETDREGRQSVGIRPLATLGRRPRSRRAVPGGLSLLSSRVWGNVLCHRRGGEVTRGRVTEL